MVEITKIKVDTSNLKKHLFLFIKGHMDNGLSIDQAEELLLNVLCEVEELFDKKGKGSEYHE